MKQPSPGSGNRRSSTDGLPCLRSVSKLAVQEPACETFVSYENFRLSLSPFKVGYIVQSNFVFPWPQTLAGAAHPSADLSPEAQWDAIPLGAKWQIFAVISMLELWDECGGGYLPHYTKGRKPGQYPSFGKFRDSVHPVLDLYDPFGFNENMSEETKERRLVSELNNGRLAQLAIFGFLCADKIPGSVPLLDILGVTTPYSGDPMIPFEGQFSYF